MKILLAALFVVPGMCSAQTSDSSFAEALSAVRVAASAAAQECRMSGKKPAAALSAASAKALAPTLKACEEALGKHIAYSYGGPNLMLQTETMAYYTHQDCDICDELDACEIKTGKLSTIKTAHRIDCEDLAPYRKGKVLYDSCGPVR